MLTLYSDLRVPSQTFTIIIGDKGSLQSINTDNTVQWNP